MGSARDRRATLPSLNSPIPCCCQFSGAWIRPNGEKTRNPRAALLETLGDAGTVQLGDAGTGAVAPRRPETQHTLVCLRGPPLDPRALDLPVRSPRALIGSPCCSGVATSVAPVCPTVRGDSLPSPPPRFVHEMMPGQRQLEGQHMGAPRVCSMVVLCQTRWRCRLCTRRRLYYNVCCHRSAAGATAETRHFRFLRRA